MKINEAILIGSLLLVFNINLTAAAFDEHDFEQECTQKAAADSNKKRGWRQKISEWWHKPSELAKKTGKDVSSGAIEEFTSQIGKNSKGEDLPVSKAIKQAVNDSGQEVFKWYTRALGLTVVVVGGSIATYWAIKNLIEKYKTPEVISEYNSNVACECMIFSEVIQNKINDFIKTTIDINKQGLPYQSLLISGPSGTGKTQLVRKMASECKMNLVVIDGAEFAKFDKHTSLKEMDHLFEWANKQNNIILLFDKAETFLDNPNNNCLSEDYKLIANFLKHIEEANNKYIVVLTTSYLNLLDKTVVKKINDHIKTELPQYDQRIKLLRLFVDQLHDQIIDKISICEIAAKIFSDDKIDQIAKMTEGLSCYELHDIIVKVKTKILTITDLSEFNEHLVDEIVINSIEKNKKKI